MGILCACNADNCNWIDCSEFNDSFTMVVCVCAVFILVLNEFEAITEGRSNWKMCLFSTFSRSKSLRISEKVQCGLISTLSISFDKLYRICA